MKLLSCLSLLSLLLFSAALHAQITKGSTFLGGSVGYASNKTEMNINQENKNRGWSVNIQLGKAIADNRVAGFFVNTGHTRSEQFNGTDQSIATNSLYGGGFFYRAYLPIGGKWYLFGQGSTGYSHSTGEQKNNNFLNGKSKNWNIYADLSPGISFAATRVIHIEAALNSLFMVNYQEYKQEYYAPSGALMSTTRQKQFITGANLTSFGNINVGLRWIIPATKKG